MLRKGRLLAAKGRSILTKKTDHLNTDLPYAVRFGLGPKLVKALKVMVCPSPVPYWYHTHLMPEDIRIPGQGIISLLDVRGGFYKLLSAARRALPAIAEVGPASMVASVPIEPDETVENHVDQDD